jgi:penicillin-binding protein 1A
VLWAPEPQRESVLSAEEAFLMVSMMKDVNQRGTAYGAVWGAGFKLPSAGKTGTTDDGADVWYVGYTPDLVAGVWIGMDRPQKVKANAQGGELAAPAWTRFMTEVYRRKPAPPDWPAPGGIVTREVIAGTNVLYAEGCTATTVAKELYVAGTEPFETCVPGQLYGADAVAAPADSAARSRATSSGTPVPVTARMRGRGPRARSTTSTLECLAGRGPPASAAPAPRDSGSRRSGGLGAWAGHRASGTGSAARPTVPPA